MLNLTVLIWLAVIAAFASFWWHSDLVKHRALKLAGEYCQAAELQLLDQTMVISRLWPARNDSGGLCLRRWYRFEFTSTGEERYKGIIIMTGKHLTDIQLDAHIIP